MPAVRTRENRIVARFCNQLKSDDHTKTYTSMRAAQMITARIVAIIRMKGGFSFSVVTVYLLGRVLIDRV